LGGRQAGLLTLKDTLTNFNTTLDGLQNNLQATDYPTVATQFSADQTMQSATLSTMAKSNKTSLFDYLT
jgi:flagellin-like hook-associated protein FlgL